jgi:hypothetical protein
LLPVTDFAYTLYRSSGPGATLPEQQVEASDIPGLTTIDDPDARPFPEDWPEDDVQPFAEVESPCLMLSTSESAPAVVRLAAPIRDTPTDSTSAEAPQPATAGVTHYVDSGHGALVQGTSGGVIGSGTTFLVDSTGTRYAIGRKGAVDGTLTSLGYRDVRPVPVPAPWMDVLGDGPALTTSDASRSGAGQ